MEELEHLITLSLPQTPAPPQRDEEHSANHAATSEMTLSGIRRHALGAYAPLAVFPCSTANQTNSCP